MIDTSSLPRRIADRLLSRRVRARLGRMARSSAIVRVTFLARRRLASQAGDTLLEVIVSALLIALIVIGTLNGLDSTNKATALQRSRSQADALAQQDEDRLRTLPIGTLTKLEHEPVTQTVEQNGTTYTITSTAKYIVDSAATTSCASSAPNAEYVQTASKVTWTSLGVGNPVVETGIVSPPPDTALVAQVTDAGEPVTGIEVHASGPSNALGQTSTNGCAILAVSPGEYTLNVNRTGYVDQNWYANSEEDTSVYPKSVYLAAETTTKESYEFGLAAELKALTFEELNPITGKDESIKAWNAVVVNEKMKPGFKLLREGPITAYTATMQTKKVVFPTTYTIFAGTCPLNEPPEEKAQTKVTFPPGGEVTTKLVLPSLVVKIWQGVKGETSPKFVTSAPEVFLSDTDKGCESTYIAQETVVPTEKGGALKYPGQPWGTYTVCVNVAYKGEKKHYSAVGQKNNNPKQEGTIVNLYEGGAKGEGLEAESCP